MKRSRTAALLLMGTAPLLLTSCTEEATTREGLYTSIDACVTQTDDRPACERAMGEARQQAEVEAPRYATREECLAAHGAEKCEERRDANGHSFFMPFMTGFLMAQMMRGGQPAGLAGSPAYRDRAGNWQRPAPAAAGGVYRAGGATAMAPVNLQPNRAPTVTRGGFGTSSSGRSVGA
jgi:uncharacterized protein YgiB involved in biofilm formation